MIVPFPSLRYLKLKAKSLQKRFAVADPKTINLFEKHGLLPEKTCTEVPLHVCHKLVAKSFKCRNWESLTSHVNLLASIYADVDTNEMKFRQLRANSAETRSMTFDFDLPDADYDQLVVVMGTLWMLSALLF